MGRKIPGKKHKTVKNPHSQNLRRLESLKHKINNPPTNSDEQEIPKSLIRIMELKEKSKTEICKRAKNRIRKKKEKLLSVEKILDKDDIFQEGMTKPNGYIPNLAQRPNESPNNFIKRLNKMTQELINEVEFEKKFDVEIKRNAQTGEIMEIRNTKRKKIKSKKKKLSLKRKEKILAKKENLHNVKDFSHLKDNIEFGEVVHQPPNLSGPKKLSSENTNKKPRYSSLLLNNLLKREENGKEENKYKNKISDVEKEKAETERKFIVEAYRKAKKVNQKTF